MQSRDAELEEADRVYERYAKPLEREHTGEFVAVSPEGDLVIGPSLVDVAEKAEDCMPAGNYLFKIGERAVGKWR